MTIGTSSRIHLRTTIVAAGLVMTTGPVAAFDPWAGSLAKAHPDHVRVLSYNVLNQFPGGTTAQQQAHTRILQAIRPDIISLQEVDPGSGPAIVARLQSVLGGTWYAHEGLVPSASTTNANFVASRWPQSLRRTDTIPASGTRGTTCVLVDLPDAVYTTDLYVMGVHFKCCAGTSEDADRQRHADAIAAWMGDARTPGGSINLPVGTPMLAVGDFNFINGGSPGPHTTMMQGTISDTATYGPAIKGDWDDSDIAEALPFNVYTMNPNTFGATLTSPTSRLDRFYYTDSVMTKTQGLVLNTLTIPATQLSQLGLLSTDTRTASDHFPVFVDFILPGAADSDPMPGDLFVTEFMPDPTLVLDENGEWLELFNRLAVPINMDGWVLRDSGTNYHVLRGSNGPLVVPPRSHFVLGIRQDPATNGSVPVDHVFTNFRLANGDDTIELYRGSIKIDGVRYNNGPSGFDPPNAAAGSTTAGRARAMQGVYTGGSTGLWDFAVRPYNAQDLGTPGGFNQVQGDGLAIH